MSSSPTQILTGLLSLQSRSASSEILSIVFKTGGVFCNTSTLTLTSDELASLNPASKSSCNI